MIHNTGILAVLSLLFAVGWAVVRVGRPRR